MKSWVMVERSLGTVIGFMMPLTWPCGGDGHGSMFSTAWVAVDWAWAASAIVSTTTGHTPVVRNFVSASSCQSPFAVAHARGASFRGALRADFC